MTEDAGFSGTSLARYYGRSKLRSAELVDIHPRVNDLAARAAGLETFAFESSERSTELVIGETKLLTFLPEIHQLRVRSGQQHDLTTDPHYFIATNTLKNRRVAAVLIRRQFELEACVLFFEHCMFGLGLGLMRGGDGVGESYVIGLEAFQVHYIHLAAQTLLRHWRTHGVSLTIKASMENCVDVMGPGNRYRTVKQRKPRHKLTLARTYDEMLAGMGPRTRRSLATKRRQLEEKAQVIFMPELQPDQALEASLTLRTRSWPVRILKFCHTRYTLLCKHPEFFSMGLRLPDGTWLSMLSGWRRNGVTFVDLQMNDSHFKKESLSAVMRAFMLEHEISLQQKQICFVGGCSVLLGRYCEPEKHCTDVILWQPGLRAALFQRIIPLLKRESRYESPSADH